MDPVECHTVIRFLYLKGCTPQKTFDKMKQTYGDNAPSYNLVKRWHREFKHGRKSVETAPRTGRPPSATDEASVRQVEAAILEDRRITIRQIAKEVKFSTGSVETIIHDYLHMHKVSARWIPRSLTPFQKRERIECSRMNLEMCQEGESKFFKRLITQDETWVYHYDPETKAQSMQWKHLDSPPPKKARVQPSTGKVTLTVFWDQGGVLMTDFLAKGTAITYGSVLCTAVRLPARSLHRVCHPVCLVRHPPCRRPWQLCRPGPFGPVSGIRHGRPRHFPTASRIELWDR